MRPRLGFTHMPASFAQAYLAPLWEWWEKGVLNTGYPPLFQNYRYAQVSFRKPSIPSTVLAPDTLRAFPLFLVELRVLLSFL